MRLTASTLARRAEKRFDRRWTLCAATSIALHAALLVMAGRALLSAGSRLELINIALRPSSGSGAEPFAGAGAPASVASLPAPVVAPAQPRKPPARPRGAKPRATITSRAPIVSESASPAATDPELGGAPSDAPPGDGFGSVAGVGGGTGGLGHRSGAGDGADERGACVYCPEPEYPLIARRRGWKGTVDVGLILLADGRVDSASVRRSSGYDVLDHEAVEVARRSRFRLPQSQPAPVQGRIEYRFELLPP